MIREIFAVHDSVVGHYGDPLYFRNAAEALRSFARGVNSPDTPMADHPEGFSLVRLGTFDDESGVITFETPTTISTAASVKETRDV